MPRRSIIPSRHVVASHSNSVSDIQSKPLVRRHSLKRSDEVDNIMGEFSGLLSSSEGSSRPILIPGRQLPTSCRYLNGVSDEDIDVGDNDSVERISSAYETFNTSNMFYSINNSITTIVSHTFPRNNNSNSHNRPIYISDISSEYNQEHKPTLCDSVNSPSDSNKTVEESSLCCHDSRGVSSSPDNNITLSLSSSSKRQLTPLSMYCWSGNSPPDGSAWSSLLFPSTSSGLKCWNSRLSFSPPSGSHSKAFSDALSRSLPSTLRDPFHGQDDYVDTVLDLRRRGFSRRIDGFTALISSTQGSPSGNRRRSPPSKSYPSIRIPFTARSISSTGLPSDESMPCDSDWSHANRCRSRSAAWFVKESVPYISTLPLSENGIRVPSVGSIQVTLINPEQTPIKTLLVAYDLSHMPIGTFTFVRQKWLLGNISKDVGCNDDSVVNDRRDDILEFNGRSNFHAVNSMDTASDMRVVYAIHLRFICPDVLDEPLTTSEFGIPHDSVSLSLSGGSSVSTIVPRPNRRIFLYKDIRVVFPPLCPDSDQILTTSYEAAPFCTIPRSALRSNTLAFTSSNLGNSF